MYKPFFKKHILIAHRGYRAFYPENTILAFEKSLKLFDMFEFDVQFTKDFEPVVFHDEYLNRCTNVKEIFGKNLKINEVSFDEVKKLDNVSWFIKNNPFKVKIPKEVYKMHKNSIPHLDEVLAFIKKNHAYANLEIKAANVSYSIIKEKILDKINKFSLKENIIISSFHHNYLKKMKGFYKALLFEKELADDEYIEQFFPESIHIEKNLATEKNMKKLNKFVVNVYTVNKRKEYFFNLGAKGVFCDY